MRGIRPEGEDRVPENRWLKQAIRRRMELAGEKYTEARRALAGDTGSQQRYPWFDAPYWAQHAEGYEQVAGEHDEALARAGVYFWMWMRQLPFALQPFRLIAGGRGPSGPDEWLAERPGAEYDAAVIEAATPLRAAGFEREVERNRQIADRVLVVIDQHSAGASAQAREAAQTRRTRQGVMGAQRPPASGSPARPWGERSKPLGHAALLDDRHQHLRSPIANAVYAPRRGVKDPVLFGLLDEWLEDLARNYAELVDGMPPDWREHGELDFEASADARGQDDDELKSSTAFRSPARMHLEHLHRGDVRHQEAVCTPMFVVGRHVSPQPDGIAVVAPGERWHIRGHRLADGTIMPCTGSYRLSSPDSAAKLQRPIPTATPSDRVACGSQPSDDARCRC